MQVVDWQLVAQLVDCRADLSELVAPAGDTSGLFSDDSSAPEATDGQRDLVVGLDTQALLASPKAADVAGSDVVAALPSGDVALGLRPNARAVAASVVLQPACDAPAFSTGARPPLLRRSGWCRARGFENSRIGLRPIVRMCTGAASAVLQPACDAPAFSTSVRPLLRRWVHPLLSKTEGI